MEQIAAMRAEWLAQLANAIDSAQRLAWQLRTHESASVEARELYGRLEAVRRELDSIGVSRQEGQPLDVDWLTMLGWSGRSADPED
jgi:hypothetical protein